MKAKDLKPGDAIEIRLDTWGPWRAATYKRPYPQISRSYHEAELIEPVHRDSMTGYVCDETNPRGYLGARAFVPAARIRKPGTR